MEKDILDNAQRVTLWKWEHSYSMNDLWSLDDFIDHLNKLKSEGADTIEFDYEGGGYDESGTASVSIFRLETEAEVIERTAKEEAERTAWKLRRIAEMEERELAEWKRLQAKFSGQASQ